MQDFGSRGSGNMTWSHNGEKVSVKWNGAFRLSDDEKDIAWVEDGATVSISDGILFASRVELRGTSGKVERSFTRNGMRRDWEPEGRLFLEAAIDKLISHSAAFAKERVARILQLGGADAVLAEMSSSAAMSASRRPAHTSVNTWCSRGVSRSCGWWPRRRAGAPPASGGASPRATRRTVSSSSSAGDFFETYAFAPSASTRAAYWSAGYIESTTMRSSGRRVRRRRSTSTPP